MHTRQDAERVASSARAPTARATAIASSQRGMASSVRQRQDQRRRRGGEHAGALGRRWRPGQQPLRLLEGGQRAGLVAGDPAVIAQAGQEHGGPDRLVGRVHPAERILNQLDGTLHRAGESGRLGRAVEQVDPVQARRAAGLGHPLPQLQGALVMVAGLGEGVGAFGGQAGLDPGRQAPGQARRPRPSARPAQRLPPPARRQPARAAR